MEDIPQPAGKSYSVGERVKIYVDSDDHDSRYHGTVCEVLEVLTDDLHSETGRVTDSYSYILRDIETDKKLLISFRHHDLVPVENSQ